GQPGRLHPARARGPRPDRRDPQPDRRPRLGADGANSAGEAGGRAHRRRGVDMNELMVRSVAEYGVDYPKRTIELVVMPYDTETVVDQPYGRMVFESVAPGAFSGIQRRVDRIRVNRDHDIERTIGRT